MHNRTFDLLHTCKKGKVDKIIISQYILRNNLLARDISFVSFLYDVTRRHKKRGGKEEGELLKTNRKGQENERERERGTRRDQDR